MSRYLLYLTIAVVLTATGCGGGGTSPRKAVYTATGSIKVFGAPLGGATVAFAPLDNQPTAFGTTDDQGNFKLTTYDYQDGAAAGKFKVIVSKTAPTAEDGTTTDGGEDHEAAEATMGGHDAKGAAASKVSLLPAQYNSIESTPLTAEVKSSGDNVFDFDLK